MQLTNPNEFITKSIYDFMNRKEKWLRANAAFWFNELCRNP
jgi:hypothetical protein